MVPIITEDTMFWIRSGGMAGMVPLDDEAAGTCIEPVGMSLSVVMTWAEISVTESGPMSIIWNRGSDPSGGFPVAPLCGIPAVKVGPVLVPVDWVVVLSV